MTIQLTKNKFRYFLAGGILILYLVFLFGLGYVYHPAYNWKILLIGSGAAALSIFSSLAVLKLPDWANTSLGGICLAAAPVLSVWMIERMQGSVLSFSSPNFWINVLFCLGLILLLLLLTNRLRLSILIGVFFFFVLGLVNHYVIAFRQNPIQPWDVLAIGTAASVVTRLEFTVGRDIVGAAAMLFLFLAAAIQIKNPPFLKKRHLYTAIPAACLAALCLSVFTYQVTSNRDRFYMDAWDTVGSSRANGLVLNLALNLETMQNKAPDGYSAEAAAKAVFRESYEAHFGNSGGDGTVSASASEEDPTSSHKPNIIAIMNESFSDLGIFGEIGGQEDYMPFLHSLTENTVRGQLVVPVLGGGTCNTEYEFLTGNTCFMLREGSYPMQQFVTNPSPSIVTTLEAQGYQSVGIHPYNPNGWNRNRAYPLLGFDRFLSIDDFTDPEYVRDYISDRSSYQKIIEQYENKEEGPIFIFNVTMQNHAGYGIPYDNFEDSYSFPGDSQYPQGKQYLSLVQESDEAFRELVEYFEQADEDTIILFFGDHQPALGDGFTDFLADSGTLSERDSKISKYLVPFYIWANYPISEEEIGTISVNYLSTLLLKTAGVELTPYNEYLADLMEILPIVSPIIGEDLEGNEFNCREDDNPYSELLNEYHVIQYNNVFDRRKRVDDIFYLNEN